VYEDGTKLPAKVGPGVDDYKFGCNIIHQHLYRSLALKTNRLMYERYYYFCHYSNITDSAKKGLDTK
jgi:hypothetical protein